MHHIIFKEKRKISTSLALSLTLYTIWYSVTSLWHFDLFSSTTLSFRPSKEAVCVAFIIVPSSCDQHTVGGTSPIKMSRTKWRRGRDNKRGFTSSRNGVTFDEVVWGQQWNSKQRSRSFKVWQMVLCIFYAVENLWLRFGWLSSSAWGPEAECILHTTAESHDVWPLCHGKLPSKEKGRKGRNVSVLLCGWACAKRERDA